MVKKTRATVKIKKTEPKKQVLSKAELEQTLINNFTNLQRVLTNLAVKFDDLSANISKLLQLFEISAKSFAEKYSGEIEETPKTDKQFIKKLDSLLDQNKTIARGIMLMEEKIRNKAPQPTKMPESRLKGMLKSRPLPRY